MKLSNFDTGPNVTESAYTQVLPVVEDSDIPVPGDVIRTTKSEGKVSKVENGYVYFTTSDGRNLRNTIANCLTIEKLADQECNMCEDEIIDEVSNELLAKYKTAAGKDASAADKSGDYERGNKRFSGIVKATKKQFDNDAKKKTDEGSMGGINRSAPSNDVSYEKVLDETDDIFEKCWKDYKQIGMKKKGDKSVPNCVPVSEESVNELSVGKLQAYKDAAKSPASFKNRPLRKLAKTIQGVNQANQRIDTKTGRLRQGSGPERSNNESVTTDEAITPWGGYTADDRQANSLAKAPKSSMQGKDNIRFSELVKDAIDTHGLKWAFDYYVNKHGLPPRHFQIFAGLAAKPQAKKVDPVPKKSPDWTDPSTTNRPKPQSWWQKLRGKLPFEE